MNPEPQIITATWAELRADEEAERMELLALPPVEAQARADVLCGKLWEPVEEELYGRIPGFDRLPGVPT